MESVSKPPPKPGKGDGQGGGGLDRPTPARGGPVLAGDDDEELPSASALRAAAWDETQSIHRREKQELEDRHRREREELDERHRQELHQLFLQKQTPSISHKRKRAGQEEEDGEEEKICARCGAVRRYSRFDLLGQDCRLRILGFLGADDLAEAAVSCKQLRDDCRDESLPQERTAVLRIPASCPHEDRIERLGTRLLAMAAATTPDGRRKFHKFSRLRVVDPHRGVEYPGLWRPPPGAAGGAATIPEITALEWSLILEDQQPGAKHNMCHLMDEHSCLASMLPNLREVEYALPRDDSYYWGMVGLWCHPHLEKVTWYGHYKGLHLSGFELSDCQGLRELRMDGACFYASIGVRPLLFLELSGRLERVSIKGARCFRYGRPVPLSQELLIGFVRSAPNLRWFRSDLAPENVAALRAERPDVTFAS
jgi:hypothetical protein